MSSPAETPVAAITFPRSTTRSFAGVELRALGILRADQVRGRVEFAQNHCRAGD